MSFVNQPSHSAWDDPFLSCPPLWLFYPIKGRLGGIEGYSFASLIKTRQPPEADSYCHVRNAVMRLPERRSSSSSPCILSRLAYHPQWPSRLTPLLLRDCWWMNSLLSYLPHKSSKKGGSQPSLLGCSFLVFGEWKGQHDICLYTRKCENREMSELRFVNKRKLKSLIWILIIL